MAETSKSNVAPTPQEKKSKPLVWIVIIVLLLIALIGVLFIYMPKEKEYKAMLEEKEAQRTEIEMELNHLMVSHDSIKMEYGTLSDSLSVKDSIILANAKEIKELLNYKWEYRKVNKKLQLLRKITQGYVKQLDSVYTVNRELTEENEKIRQQYAGEQQKTRELTKDKEQLIEKVTEASAMRAYNVSAYGVRFTGSGRERVTDKAKKVERVKVCFTVGENKLVEAGTKTFYIRILRPDNVVVMQKMEDVYTFEFNGEKMEYTTKKEINYENTATDLCIFWTKKNKAEAAMTGVYNVFIYSDGVEIGKTSFELK
jgi:flagellar basal body-associated protein FliL